MDDMKMRELTFVEVTEENIDEVYEIEETSFNIPWSKAALLEGAKRQDTVFLAAVCRNKPVAYIGAYLLAGDAEITNVATLKDYRSFGIAGVLMNEVLKICREKGCERVTLEVRPSNKVAIALYKKFGMQENGRRKNYYADNGEDALIFWGKL